MVLDPVDWDKMPEPLIGSASAPKMFHSKESSNDVIPW